MYEFKLPDLGEGIHEGELIKWHVATGEKIKEDDPLCDFETDKATVTIPSPRSGTIVSLNGEPGETIAVNTVLVVIDESDTGAETPGTPKARAFKVEAATPPSGERPAEKRPTGKAVAAPATRRMAREMGININRVSGSGPGGRITPEDLKNYSDGPADPVREPKPKEASPPAASRHPGLQGIPFLETSPLPDFEAQGPVRREALRSLRRKTAVKTTSSMILVPHVAHMDAFDVTEIEKVRKALNTSARNDEKLTLMGFIIRAAAALLKEHPPFNASIDADRMEIVYKRFYHIGFAADTPKGLMVPVVKNANKKTVSSIAKEIRELAQKARSGTISLEEISHGTFTITNVGAIGGTGMVPTINTPESAILGMGRVDKKPVVKNDEIVIRKMLPVTLSFDHRIADGAQAARLITALKKMMEDPALFMTGI